MPPGYYLPKTNSASLAFQLLPCTNFWTPRSTTYKTMSRTNALQHIKELNKLMWNSSYYLAKCNLSFFYCLYVIARVCVCVYAHKSAPPQIKLFCLAYLSRNFSCFLTFVVKAFGLTFLLISIPFLFLFGHLIQAKWVNRAVACAACTNLQIFRFFWKFPIDFCFRFMVQYERRQEELRRTPGKPDDEPGSTLTIKSLHAPTIDRRSTRRHERSKVYPG